MRIFRLVQHSFAFLGLELNQSTAQKYSINEKNMLSLSILCIALTSSCAYIFFDAKTFQEYAISVYIASTFLLGAACFTICVWKKQPLFKLIDSAEKNDQ